MKRKPFLIVIITTLSLFLFFTSPLSAHTYRLSLVVDTDMALDDIRALAMILNSDMFDLHLLVASDGSVSPLKGYNNLKRLVKYFDQEKIRIFMGRALLKPAPPWRSWCESLNWPEAATITKHTAALPAAEGIVETLKTVDDQVIYLCLGPLTNLADALRLNTRIKEKISRILFFGGPPGLSESSWNYDYDPQSADYIFECGLPVYALTIPKEKVLPFDQKFYASITSKETPAARLITTVHQTPVIQKLLSEGHFRVWDEMAVIYLHHPFFFTFEPLAQKEHIMVLADWKIDRIQEAYGKILDHSADFHLIPRRAVVLNDFPSDPSLFRDDLKPMVKKIIEKHGLEEWKACLLTNEFHRHLGIYSLIGAKMGIRAREIFEAPFDTLKVVSLAGHNPPLSCMNDGLQVATGASLGRGTIEISYEKSQPAARFFYKDREITLRLKKEWVSTIKAKIKESIEKYGGLTPEYFAHIRRLSIAFWYDLDRGEIFNEISTIK